jgi:hypothetical protein
MTANASRILYVTVGIAGALLSLYGGWWTLLGRLFLAAGFVLALAFGEHDEPGYYLAAALVLLVLAQFSDASSHRLRDSEPGDSSACGIGYC